MATNKLSHLVGDYESDSENENSDHRKKSANSFSTDWTQCTDVNSGHPYYWNIITKEVTWEMPTEYRLFLDEAAKQGAQILKKWILCYTDDNAPYYFNEVTREISWEKPDDYAETTKSHTNKNATSSNKQKAGHSNHAENSIHSNAKAKLNLVPEYNSDDSDEENQKSSEKPLFPSSNTKNNQTIKSIVVSNDSKNDREASNDIQQLTSVASTKKMDKKTERASKEKPSFASIITGGRSPQQETVDITLYTSQESDETINPTNEYPNETEPVPQKTFQRKRRIEFNVSAAHAKRANQSDSLETNSNNEARKETDDSIDGKKYTNFHKSGTEFSSEKDQDQQSSSGSNDTTTKNIVTDEEIKNEQNLLEAKLNFLCQGRPDVSPVQIIQIQIQALQAAHIAEALHADYLLEWMKNISNDLCKLENDAAPAGWKCLWNREKALYCYENETTGEIKWEYPEVGMAEQLTNENTTVIADDAMDMDICTTPPPNEHEDLTVAFYQTEDHFTADSATPPPPPSLSNRTTNETAKNDTEKPLDDELASFYSVIGKLDPETTNEENSCDKTSPRQERSVSPENSVSETDDKKKKKKKKSKKLEPWRSGNLETWINKWQKAQKELDG